MEAHSHTHAYGGAAQLEVGSLPVIVSWPSALHCHPCLSPAPLLLALNHAPHAEIIASVPAGVHWLVSPEGMPLWGANRFRPVQTGSGLVLRCLGPGFTVLALSPGFRSFAPPGQRRGVFSIGLSLSGDRSCLFRVSSLKMADREKES